MQLTVDPINRTFILDIDPVVDKDLKIVDLTTDLVTALAPLPEAQSPLEEREAIPGLDAFAQAFAEADYCPDCATADDPDQCDCDVPFRTMPELDAIFSRILLLP